jgi:hypothetical protein
MDWLISSAGKTFDLNSDSLLLQLIGKLDNSRLEDAKEKLNEAREALGSIYENVDSVHNAFGSYSTIFV